MRTIAIFDEKNYKENANRFIREAVRAVIIKDGKVALVKSLKKNHYKFPGGDPIVAKNYGIDAEVYCAEINFTQLFQLQLPDATYTPLPKYPTVFRDLSVICAEEVTVADAENVITAAAGKLLRGVKLFDIYRGTGVPEGKKSMAFSLELRADDRTLTDTDSESVITKVLAALKEKLNAALR